jgi:uncharacterized Zn finger protein (UPF0148 family)
MTETIEKAVCESCGVDVRENTLFCYNCGSKLETVTLFETNGSVAVNDRSKAALDELADKLSHGSESADELAAAASERKRTRVTQQKRLEYRWEPRDDSPLLPLVFGAIVFVATLFVVIFLAVWR